MSHQRTKAIFDKPSNKANPEFFVNLMDMPFGKYGRLTDRYGVDWFFSRGKTKG